MCRREKEIDEEYARRIKQGDKKILGIVLKKKYFEKFKKFKRVLK